MNATQVSQTASTGFSLFSLPTWLVIGIIAFSVLYLIRNVFSDATIKARAHQRFQYTHRDVLPFLTKTETKQMYQVLNNTIANAKMSSKHSEYVKMEKSLPKRARKETRRVVFNLE